MYVCVLQAVLAAIVLEALLSLFKQFKDIVKYFKLSKPDMVSQWDCPWLCVYSGLSPICTYILIHSTAGTKPC